MPELSNLTWLAFLGTFAACWRQVAGFANRLRSFFVINAHIRGEDTTKAIQMYCNKHFKRSPFGDRYYQSMSLYVRPLSRVQEVAWERPPKQASIYFAGCVPLLIGGISEPNSIEPFDGRLSITVIRGTIDIEDLIIKALAEWNKGKGGQSSGNRYHVRRVQGRRRDAGYMNDHSPSGAISNRVPEPSSIEGERYIGWSKDDIGQPVSKAPMESLSLPEDVQDSVGEFKRWKESESWFKSRKVPWRRGWLLHGPPGTGKTSLVRALAQMEDMPIWSFDLASLSNEEMVEKWRDMQENVPCVALFEDIDAVFDKRTNVHDTKGGGLTFDCFLNCLSGIESADGVFVIVTTNHIEKIDPALGISENGVSTRPGRLDRVILMPPLDDACRARIAHRILVDCPELIPDLVEESKGYTGAQATELFVKHAQQHFWSQPT